MSPQYRRFVAFAVSFLVLLPALASAAAVEALFDLSSTVRSPFPSDRFTVFDHDNKTGLRVSLPKPDCAIRSSDCADIDVINTLDGFNLQPRLSIPFSGPIDVSSVSSSTVFLVRLGDVHGGRSRHVVGINQVVWDPPTNTLHAESDEFLDQHTRYLLVVTDGVRDTAGHAVRAGAFAGFVDGERDDDDDHDRDSDRRRHRDSDRRLAAYREELSDALEDVRTRGRRIVAASVFTTQSATAVLEKIRQQIKSSHPAPATMLGTFALSSVTAIQWDRQIRAKPTGRPDQPQFSSSFLATPALNLFPGAIGSIVFGTFMSPDWETADKFIPPIGTRTGVPAAQGTNTLYFNLFFPSGTPPAGGWPVAIFGHGFTDSKQGAPIAVASTFASHGVATIAINVVGHGGGALGTLTIIRNSEAPITIPDGGRGIDQNGDNNIDSTEGVNAAPPRGIISNRDGLRQTVADLMQLVRVIQTGGIPGLSHTRIYYAGQSFGGIYGVKLLALEDSIRAGVANVPGGPIIEIARLSPSFRALVGISLAGRVPSLLNAGPLAPPAWGFNENIPLRDQPPVINTVPGAMAIQEVLDNTEWVSQSGNPVAYAPHLRKSPLHDIEPPPVIIQFAKGDQTVPNPTASAIFRAGDLTDRSTYFRNDLVRAARPSPPFVPSVPANPHTFLTNIGNATVADLAIAAQQQIAIFLESDGIVIVDPDGAGPFFEVPIKDPLPETLNF
ncbi:MAG: hypothetical protein DMD89_25290 [Candidatus Rokuibacteriota bacterium]|nr:MAG: hypothetical protein DMD89_25290 [Candidatus Rokubacteria bacterium]